MGLFSPVGHFRTRSPRLPSDLQVKYLTTGFHFCVGSTPTCGTAEGLLQYNWMLNKNSIDLIYFCFHSALQIKVKF